MADINLNSFARFFGVNTLLGLAQKVGLNPPPPSVSMRNVVNLAEGTIKPLAPVDLQPVNGASGISNNPHLFFRDPAGTPVATQRFEFLVTQNGVIVDPSHTLTGGGFINNPLSPPGPTWFFPLPPGQVTLTVAGLNRAGKGPASTSTFAVVGGGEPPPPPPPTGTLTLRVTIASFGQERHIISVGMVVSGPGVPAGAIPFQLSQDLSTATAAVPLPPPSGQGAVTYTVVGTASFHFDGLINTNTGSISGPEDASVDLSAPASISWTGQNRVARFSIRHVDFDNVFTMTFDGL